MRVSNWISRLTTAATTLVVCASAFGQARDIARIERNLAEAEDLYFRRVNPAMSVGERAVLEYGGALNFSFIAVDDIDGETHILRQTDARLFADLDIDGVHQFFGQLRYTYRDWNTGDDFDGDGDQARYPLGDRWWYRFNLGRALEAYEGVTTDFNVVVQVGRQYVEWASGLTFSDQLYAVRGWLEVGDFELEGLFGLTPNSTVIDFDHSRPSFDDDTARQFAGGKLTYSGIKDHEPYLFILDQRDKNAEDFQDFGTLFVPLPTEFEYNSTYWGIGATGRIAPRLTYEIEGVYETGDNLTDPLRGAQTREDVDAWAGRFNLTWYPRDEGRSRLEFETIGASGDGDRDLDTSSTFGGNLSGTDDQAFNAFGFAKTGLAFGAPISNILMFRVGGSTYPLQGLELTRDLALTRDLQVGMDVLVFMKMLESAPINEASSSDRYLGVETDFYANWRLTSDLLLTLRYGVFFPGKAIEQSSERHYFFTGITYSF